jgi:hypothetical protein
MILKDEVCMQVEAVYKLSNLCIDLGERREMTL